MALKTDNPDGPARLPEVEVLDSDGNPLRTVDWLGRTTVLFCYPRAMTPGCTTEAQEFSAAGPELARLNARAVGVSRDLPAALRRFRDKSDLSVDLVSDEAGVLTEALGVWIEKSMYGRKSMGVERATFIFGPEGRVQHQWRRVRVAGHVEAVLDWLVASQDG